MAITVQEGHAAHSKELTDQPGLKGEFGRPIKIVMIGAGSGFTPTLAGDILKTPGTSGGELALVDIDAERLGTMRTLVEKIVTENGQVGRWCVTASTERTESLRNAHYVIISIEVSGLSCVRFDNDIPLEYGVDQCIGDTVGPGGLFKGLRTLPVIFDILADCERLCPDALVLNYTNPMSVICLAASRRSSMRFVGLCHSVQGTTWQLAERLRIPLSEITWECAGINHLAWITRFERRGADLYPRLKEMAKADLAGRTGDNWDLVRKHMMLHFGAFITESSGHLSEYLPYYRKRKGLMDTLAPRKGYDGGSGFYVESWPKWRTKADDERLKMIAGEMPLKKDRTWEYASWIVEAIEKNEPFRIHANVPNCRNGAGPLISNLVHDGVVEVQCLVDANGVQPVAFGDLPPQMAAICRSHMGFYDMAARAALELSKEAAVHALLLDPLTSAVCTPDEIREMTMRLFDAEKEFLPGYR